MALDNRLTVYNEQGNPVDYDILASDVKFLPDGKDLPTKLAEMEQEIGEAGQVNEIIMNGQTYTPTNKVINLGTVITQHQDISGKVDSVPGKGLSTNDFTNALKAKLEALDPYTKAQVNAAIQQALNGIADVSVTTNQDGTFTIHVGNTDYIINLNHTHEDMAKVVVVSDEADLPATLDEDTIYGVNDEGELSVVYIGGYPFYGGSGGTTTPVLRRPTDGTSVDLGNTTSGTVSGTIKVKGRYLTQPLTIQLTGTGFTFSNTQPTGVTVDSTTQLTVTAAAANALLGVDIVVVYTGDVLSASATLGIVGSTDNINAEVTVIAHNIESVIADWEGEDAQVGTTWVDRINSIPFNLNGTAAKVSDGYQFNNLSSQRAAYALTAAASNTLLNSSIMQEFTCIIKCKVKFAQAGKWAMIMDFGCFGVAKSGLSMYSRIYQDGTLGGNFKQGGNNLTGFSDEVTTAATSTTFSTGTYVTMTVKMGVRLLNNGKQEIYTEFDGSKIYAVLDTPVNINFQGIEALGGDIDSAFSLGFGYDRNANADAPAAAYDIIYESITIYNTEI